ncbi:glycosyltransferase family 2 protein [Bradyrhizobium sp. IC3195]|uniref:glycosyltransferase family 2 protein n=1 Tax=Bradyrhizobium sp. IC3195 TaxID=2793804 RepID=UPI001CD7B0E9|nr:glycosyltransferase family 2 protein [Bradyrhizobium sp. IC3195]MCA1467133.1 glycosyltransferase family 2 protein [Bradyrhizobium sp. IC3195]
MTKVDIVVPCYNYGRFLEASVSSILVQSVSDLRVLIIDDGSSDESLTVARKLARDDSRVTVTSHSRNEGHINTFNEGIAWSSADYFLLLSADDILVPGALKRATEIMDENPDVVLTHGKCILWFDDLPLPIIEPQRRYSWERHDLIGEMCTTGFNFVPAVTAIARTSVQKSVGDYRPSLPHTGDMEMWLRFAANGSVARIGEVQGIYRRHSTAMSNAYYSEKLSDYRQCQSAFDSFFDEYGGRVSGSVSLRRIARRALAKRVFCCGIGLLRRGRGKEAVHLMREAMKMDPSLRYFPPLWHLLKFPGPEGRKWFKSAVGGAATRLWKQSGAMH